MKRIGHIYDEQVCTLENCKLAIMMASVEKRTQENIQRYLTDIDGYAEKLLHMLETESYIPSEYVKEDIVDGLSGKVRTLFKPRFFPDQCVHWALMLPIKDYIQARMYKYNCGSIDGRGTSYAKKYTEMWIRTDPRNTKYCFKGDVRHFYESCNHDILKKKLARIIKDKKVLRLFSLIIDSVPDEYGLPLGNYTSQWLGNIMLTSLDHFIKEVLKIKYYIRYADDIVLFSSNKRVLHRVVDAIKQFLSEESLVLKDNWQVFRVEYFNKKKQKFCGRKVDFVGYAIGRQYTRIRKRIAIRMLKNYRELARGNYSLLQCARFGAYYGWIVNSDSENLYRKHVINKIDIKKIKEVLAKNSQAAMTISIYDPLVA